VTFSSIGVARTVMVRHQAEQSATVMWTAHEVHLRELDDEPHDKNGGDENHQPAHPCGRPPVIFSPSRLPVPPQELGFAAADDHTLIGHRRASWMLSDIVWAGAFHHHIMTIVGQTATPARTAQLVSEFRFPATPAINTAETQTVARTALSHTSCMPKSTRRG